MEVPIGFLHLANGFIRNSNRNVGGAHDLALRLTAKSDTRPPANWTGTGDLLSDEIV